MQAGGENIAAGQRSAVEVNEDWTNSPGHYANMINPAYTKLGVGCLIDDNGYKYWVRGLHVLGAPSGIPASAFVGSVTAI